MDVVWVVVGVLLLLVTLLDAFLAVLNYDEAGLFVDRIVRAQWMLLRSITRRVGRRWRPVMLRQVTGILIVVTILWWVAGIVFGFAFIYLGAMGMSGLLVTSSGVEPDFLGALYLSLGQFATVGVDNIGPDAAWMNLLTVAEAMISVVMLSFIITFLGSVYGVIQSLQSLSANFFRAGRGITDPIDTLRPFFPDGRPRGLDAQLDSILDALTDYGHGLSQNRAAYYFQSGRDQFALPFSLYMTSGVIGALRWGLPTGSDPSTEPGLLRLTEAFDDFRARLQRALRWSAGPTPAAVAVQEFREAVDAYGKPGRASAIDPWVARFLTIDRRMADLVRSDAPLDVDDAYRRYVAWLPFESQAQWLLSAVSRDLDYQPIYRGIASSPEGVPLDAPRGGYELLPMDPGAAAEERATPVPGRSGRGGSWLRRRGLFIDPGLVRLSSAGRTIAGVVVAMGIAAAGSIALGADPLNGTVLAGLVALFASPAAIGAPSGGRRWVGLVAVVPTALGITMGTLIPRDALATGAAMALVAAAAVWMRRFGARAGGLGQLGFIAYYFALILGLGASQLLLGLAAGAIGLVSAWGAGLIPGPSLPRRVDGAAAALYQRVAYLLETAIDLVSSARHDRRLSRMLARQQEAVQKTAAAIAGHLDETDASAQAVAPVRDLRLRVFALRLAVDNLVALVPGIADMALTIEQRARLAADLVSAESDLDAAVSRSGRPAEAPSPVEDSDSEPMGSGRVAAAIWELRTAADELERARVEWASSSKRTGRVAHESPVHVRPDAPATEEQSDVAGAGAAASGSSGTGSETASWRQALQAGLSTGLALLLGSLVSTSHQYWAALPAFSILSGSDGETRSKALQRILATLLGATVGFGLAILAGHSPAVALPLLGVSVFFIAFLRPVSSAWTAFWQTLLLATVYDALGTLSVETLQVRVVETAIGAVVAVTVSALVLPTRTRSRMLGAMTDVVRRSASIAHQALSPASGGGGGGRDAADLDDELRDLARALTVLEDSARPLRSNPGSLRRAGVETQLTALWSIAYDVRRLATDDGGGVSGPARRRLADATADDFASAQAVLQGRLPRRLWAGDDLIAEAGSDVAGRSRPFVLRVLRLNQALLALIESLKPGTVAAMALRHASADPADARGERARTR